MTLSLDSLRILDAIARRGSFAGAAEELDRAPSAISYGIQKLEEETGALLFDRSGRRAQLTAAGELVLEQGRALLEGADNLVSRARALETGWEPEITLALDAIHRPERLWPLVRAFDEQAPHTSLRILTEVLQGTLEALQENRAQLGVTVLEGKVPAGLRSRELGRVRFLYVAHPDHPAVSEGPLDAESLARYRAIAVADTARHQPARTVRLMHLQPVLTVSNFAAKISALENGLGIGTLPEGQARPLLESGRLVELNMREPEEPAPVHMIWRVDSAGKALRWLLRHLPAYLEEDA